MSRSRRNTPDYHALVAANMVLGGQFVSRINLNLREEKGFTYGARTSFDFRRMAGPFALQVSVQTAATAQAIHESFDEIAAIRGPRPVSSDELALGVAALTRGYARNFETAEQVARAVTQIALYDLPDDYFAEFVPRVERVTADDVTRVSAQHLDPVPADDARRRRLRHDRARSRPARSRRCRASCPPTPSDTVDHLVIWSSSHLGSPDQIDPNPISITRLPNYPITQFILARVRYQRVGVSLFGAIALIVVVLAMATVWLFLTNPVTVATAVSEGEISPFVRDLADVLLQALQGLLKYL